MEIVMKLTQIDAPYYDPHSIITYYPHIFPEYYPHIYPEYYPEY